MDIKAPSKNVTMSNNLSPRCCCKTNGIVNNGDLQHMHDGPNCHNLVDIVKGAIHPQYTKSHNGYRNGEACLRCRKNWMKEGARKPNDNMRPTETLKTETIDSTEKDPLDKSPNEPCKNEHYGNSLEMNTAKTTTIDIKSMSEKEDKMNFNMPVCSLDEDFSDDSSTPIVKEYSPPRDSSDSSQNSFSEGQVDVSATAINEGIGACLNTQTLDNALPIVTNPTPRVTSVLPASKAPTRQCHSSAQEIASPEAGSDIAKLGNGTTRNVQPPLQQSQSESVQELGSADFCLKHPGTKKDLPIGCTIKTYLKRNPLGIEKLEHLVAGVVPGTLADDIGLQADDNLLLINGIDLSNFENDELVNFLAARQLEEKQNTIFIKIEKPEGPFALSLDALNAVEYEVSFSIMENGLVLNSKEEVEKDKNITDLRTYKNSDGQTVNCKLGQCWLKHHGPSGSTKGGKYVSTEGQKLVLSELKDLSRNFVLSSRNYFGTDDGNAHKEQWSKPEIVISFASQDIAIDQYIVATSASSVGLMPMERIRKAAKVLKDNDPRLFYVKHVGVNTTFRSLGFPGKTMLLAYNYDKDDFFMKDVTGFPPDKISNDTEVLFQIQSKDPTASCHVPSNSERITEV